MLRLSIWTIPPVSLALRMVQLMPVFSLSHISRKPLTVIRQLCCYQHRITSLTYAYPLYYGPAFLDKDPELGRRFMVAYLQGVKQYNEGKTERNLEILQNYTRLDRDLLKQDLLADDCRRRSVFRNNPSGNIWTGCMLIKRSPRK